MLAGVTPQWLCGMFSRIALRYDLTNTVISAGLDQVWRRRLAQYVARHTTQTVLDVACGTGGVMAQLAQCCPSTTCLIGVDLTETMLRVGRQRLATAAPVQRVARVLHIVARVSAAEADGFPDVRRLVGTRALAAERRIEQA